MEENVYLDKLERRDIKPTAIKASHIEKYVGSWTGRIVTGSGNSPGYGRQIDHIPDNSSLSVSSPDT